MRISPIYIYTSDLYLYSKQHPLDYLNLHAYTPMLWVDHIRPQGGSLSNGSWLYMSGFSVLSHTCLDSLHNYGQVFNGLLEYLNQDGIIHYRLKKAASLPSSHTSMNTICSLSTTSPDENLSRVPYRVTRKQIRGWSNFEKDITAITREALLALQLRSPAINREWHDCTALPTTWRIHY